MMNSMGNRMSLKGMNSLWSSVGHDLVPGTGGCPVIDVSWKFVGLARPGRTHGDLYPAFLDMQGTGGRCSRRCGNTRRDAENIPEAQPVDDSYDARRLEENRRKVEDKMSRQGLVPKVY